MSDVTYTDVLICGGGAVGLLTGLILARMGVKVQVIEKKDKANGPMFGRAISIYPRTLELLDQLGITDELIQTGVIMRSVVNFDKEGKRIPSRGWNSMFDSLERTYFKYILNIRLFYTEQIIQKLLKDEGGVVEVNSTLKDLEFHEYTSDGTNLTGDSKFIVGADGARSKVRDLVGIGMDVDLTELRWIRVDGIMETNMPDQELVCASVESPTHGNVFWTKIDHGRQRIGFALPSTVLAKYGENMTEEDMKVECTQAMKPFSLKFIKVDWWTLYTVRQSVAKQYFTRDCVLLAGDACHIHSSAAAQGMNTGIHDAVNLGWKLGGVVKGWYDKSILNTYETDRRPVAEQVIALDRIFSSLISNKIPQDEAYTYSTDPRIALTEVINRSIAFNVGLGIEVGLGPLSRAPKTGMINGGARAPDAKLYPPGFHACVRLMSLLKNTGVFWVLVFAGQPLLTRPAIRGFKEYLDSNVSFTRSVPPGSVNFLTIISGIDADGNSALGGESFGRFYYDHDNTAHVRYGIATTAGGVVVVRPDGMLGYAVGLDGGAEAGEYFSAIFRHKM
ncbi:pentachlorophenol 4-monooxygenase [Xylogone sp. PMI_703]|nr:pentachlorophenol 4-monooxygenase [Xylogone sp. PMI_703]